MLGDRIEPVDDESPAGEKGDLLNRPHLELVLEVDDQPARHEHADEHHGEGQRADLWEAAVPQIEGLQEDENDNGRQPTQVGATPLRKYARLHELDSPHRFSAISTAKLLAICAFRNAPPNQWPGVDQKCARASTRLGTRF